MLDHHTIMRMLTCTSLLLAPALQAQDATQVRFGNSREGSTASYADGTLTVEVMTEGNGSWAGTITVRVSDLDLEQAEVEENSNTSPATARIDLKCKGEALCASKRGEWVGLQLAGNGSPNYDDALVSIQCDTQEECERFLDVLKASAGSSDIPHGRYAAFAQSAGFDANGGWGAATGNNLNSAMGAANAECSSRSNTRCGDEGYCVLESGMWSAWASDRKYQGAKAFACNYRTKREAANAALAACGSSDCQLLWTGKGD